jgi:hypothetical protein
MEMEEEFTREFGFGTRADGRTIQRNRNVRYFSGCECRKCFELRVRKSVFSDISQNRHHGFCKRVRLWEKEPAAVLQKCGGKRPWKISRSSRYQERSMEMEEDYSQESSQEQSSAEEEYSATEMDTSLRVQKSSQESSEKESSDIRNRHQRFCEREEKEPAAVLQMCRRMWSSKRPWKIM